MFFFFFLIIIIYNKNGFFPHVCLADVILVFGFIIQTKSYNDPQTCCCYLNFCKFLLYIASLLVERLRIGLDKRIFVNSYTVRECEYI